MGFLGSDFCYLHVLIFLFIPWHVSLLSSGYFWAVWSVDHPKCFCVSFQVRHLYNTGDLKDIHLEIENFVNSRTPKLTRNGRPACCPIAFGILELDQCRNKRAAGLEGII